MNETQKKLLQYVFDYYNTNHKWPNCRKIQIEFRKIDDPWSIANELGWYLIRIPDKYHIDDDVQLTMEGIASCKGSEAITGLFISVLKAFIERYISDDLNQKITSTELKSKLLISDEQCSLICPLLFHEGGITSGASINRDNNYYEFTISPDILDYENVNTIDDYIELRQKARAKHNSSRNIVMPFLDDDRAQGIQFACESIRQSLPLLISDNKLLTIVDQDIYEIGNAFSTKSWKTICILCDSASEAILSDLLFKLQLITKINDNSLYELIKLAVDNKIIPRRVGKSLEVIREARNLVHPDLAKIDGPIEKSTAEASFKLLEVLVQCIAKYKAR